MFDLNTRLMIENLADRWNDYSISAEEIAQELDRIQFDTLEAKDFEEIEEIYKARIRYNNDEHPDDFSDLCDD